MNIYINFEEWLTNLLVNLFLLEIMYYQTIDWEYEKMETVKNLLKDAMK